MPQQQHQIEPSNERQIQTALRALEEDATLSLRRAAAIYNVSRTTLSYRRAGRPSQADCWPKSMNLTKTEEGVVVEHILELITRGFPPRLAAVADIANSLRAERNLGQVGLNWPTKYGIQDEDTYNFDEAGFIVGQISTGAVVTASERRGRPKAVQQGNREWTTVIQGINATGWAIPPFIIFKGRYHLSALYKEDNLPQDWVIAVSENGWTTNELGLQWLKYFDEHTKRRVVGAYRLLVIDGHESHDSLEFQQYCKENKIITICMPPHSSHLLQPLDVGCFSPLKTAYGRQAENLMRNRITHITKLEFLPCFIRAYNAAITPSNIQGGFQGAGLVPFDPERVITALDVRLRTPSPLLPINNEPWQSQTPSNTLALGSQSTLVKARIKRHIDSLPSSMVGAFEKVSKGAAIIAHKLVLAQKEIAELRAANEAATRCRSHKRKRVQAEGTLIVEDGDRLAALKDFGSRSDGKKPKTRVRAEAGEPSQRRCGRCNQTGYSARTCKQVVEVNSE
ncbi:hypothetical protein PTT_12453 [Pyrenophora teres f. teres 0-1]|uniref:Uncharacterized protein n=1 Tax=Pyrenophora teres f. teres (strain 0-1) TaxID=861557 RepID=E3RTU1_PYRTT|nr:hypothetical protein PTT_12453 [Pyrenophora teres f. teres 0-1]